jgi:tetratricopeptide (TPR) repeat protein
VVPSDPRIEDLRRRVERDPASIAFAQLAEEYRRQGLLREAIETCRAGLVHHPEYIFARVTLGRCLLTLGELEEARDELNRVLVRAPDNLAAIRGLAEIHRRRGELGQALEQYRSALESSQPQPSLAEVVLEVSRELDGAARVVQTPDVALPGGVDIARDLAGTSPARNGTMAARRLLDRLERWLLFLQVERDKVGRLRRN